MLGHAVDAAHAQTSTPLQELNVTAYPATLVNLVNAAIKLHAIDIGSDDVIDDYARIAYCDVYQRYHLDEFTWRRVRVALRTKIQQDEADFPTTMFLERTEHFGKYDFASGTLLMLPDSIMHNVTELLLLRIGNGQVCKSTLTAITEDFVSLLDKPVWIDGIKMSDQEAQAVISGLTSTVDEENVIRTGYGRYIIGLDSSGRAPVGMKNSIVFVSHLLRVTFYEDAAYQKPFWRGLSSVRGSNADIHKTFQGITFKGVDEPSPDAASPALPTLPPVDISPAAAPH
jgi:hypothetical protein